MRVLLLSFYLLSADQADYDGKNLVFSGKFQVEHPMGLLKAEKATLNDLQLRHPEKKGSLLSLEEGVSVDVTRGKTPFAIHARKALCELPPATLFSLFQFQELEFFEEVKIQMLGNLSAEGGSAIYKMGSLTLYPSVPSSYCQLYRGEERIDAREIRFDLLKEELLVKGNVRFHSTSIQGKESFALADRIIFQSKEETLLLESDPPKRVLFWQEGLTLSAPEIAIKRDLRTKKESIEGKGDVHFAFDLEEKNVIEQLLSKYL